MNELQEVKDRLALLEGKVDQVFASVEKIRNYFKWTFYVTIVTIVLPALALGLVIPFFLSTLTGPGSAGGLINNLNGLGN